MGKLFEKSSRAYSIPLYQRNYTWGEEQIQRLLSDILDEAEKVDRNDYFLGNLVVAPPADLSRRDDPFDVIDGQQRLTTLYILLNILKMDFKMQVGELQPLTYAAREKATRALHGVADASNSPAHDKSDDAQEDAGILQAAKLIRQYLENPAFGDRFLSEPVIDYLLRRVLLVRMPIDRTMDLNRYFEVMNTRGAQLNPVDIVKARLLRYLSSDTDDRALFNQVWTACSDMDRYVGMSFTAGDTSLRTAVFGEDWNAVPPSSFATLRDLLIDTPGRAAGGGDGDSTTPRDTGTASGSGEAIALGAAVMRYATADARVASSAGEDEHAERFLSQVSFPTFLLHVLAVRRSGDAYEDDRQLDDKKLISRFAAELETVPEEARGDWVRAFTTDLLRLRFLFDSYVIKRDTRAPTDSDSTSETESGAWSLVRLARGERKRGAHGKVLYSPRYPATFSGDSERDNQRRLVLLQSALRITYTSPRTMHWMTDLLTHLKGCADSGVAITGQGVLARVERFALVKVREAMDPRLSVESGSDGFPLGFGIPRILFTYLDYLLVQKLGRDDFGFSYRTSIEHFSPVTLDEDHTSPEYRLRDTHLRDYFGNLALVTVSTNSKFSNLPPLFKAQNSSACSQSLKLQLMADQARRGSWNDDDVRRHHDEMVGYLREAVAALPPS